MTTNYYQKKEKLSKKARGRYQNQKAPICS